MNFEIKNLEKSIVSVARELGYVIIDTNEKKEYNLVRKIHFNNFPRFHIYLKQQGNNYIFSLHLDQKAPVYKGAHAHNGEYFGPVVEAEGDRIKEVLQK